MTEARSDLLPFATLPTVPSIERRSNGQAFPVAGRLVVCRFPVSSSLPIPLGVREPIGTALLTWIFTGPDEGGDGREPHCLIVLEMAEQEPTLRDLVRVVVETHFHDLAVALAPQAEAGLSASERALLCQAVLAAITPATLDPLAPILNWLAPEMRDLPLAKEAPELTLRLDGRATLTGYVVPDYVLLIAGNEHACHRVERARLRFGAETNADLILVPARALAGRPDRAILVGGGGFTPARLRAETAGR